MIWAASIPMLSGKLDPISYLLICMLPMLLAKLSDSISRGLMSYKNLKISKDKVVDIIEEPEETGSMEPLHTATHEITFDNVDFSYVPGEPVLKHATFTVPDQKLTAIVGDSGSGKSTILNLIAKYYEANGGTISIGGKPINHVAAERVLEQISMVDQDVFLLMIPFVRTSGTLVPMPRTRKSRLPAGRLIVTASSARWKRDTIRRPAKTETFSLAVSVSEFPSPALS